MKRGYLPGGAPPIPAPFRGVPGGVRSGQATLAAAPGLIFSYSSRTKIISVVLTLWWDTSNEGPTALQWGRILSNLRMPPRWLGAFTLSLGFCFPHLLWLFHSAVSPEGTGARGSRRSTAMGARPHRRQWHEMQTAASGALLPGKSGRQKDKLIFVPPTIYNLYVLVR